MLRHERVLGVVVLLLGALVLLGCRPRGAHKPIAFKLLEPGLEYAVVHMRPDNAELSLGLHVLRFDPKRFRLEAVRAQEVGMRLADAQAFREKSGAIAAINGGLFDPKYRPLGLLVSRGEQLHRLRRVDHGVFTIATAGPEMQHARVYKRPQGLDFAIECGPRLVVKGQPLSFKQRLARRTVIGSDERGRVILLVSGGVLRLGDLAAFLVQPREDGGLGLRSALNLDGGSSSMFDLKHGQTTGAVRSFFRVPIALTLSRRRSQAPK